MNLLAFIVLVGAVAIVMVTAIFVLGMPDESKDIARAVSERIRNPKPSHSERMLEELHRHWETTDRIRDGQAPGGAEDDG